MKYECSSQEIKKIAISYGIAISTDDYFPTFRFVIKHAFDRRTNSQTERQTEREKQTVDSKCASLTYIVR